MSSRVRKAMTLLLAFFAAAAVGDDVTRTGDDGAPDSALIRLALSVTDADRSKRFYTFAFGFTAGFDGDITRPAVREMLHLEAGQRARFIVLHSAEELDGEHPGGAMIGLLQVSNPGLPSMRRPAGRGLASGEGILAIMTSDIEAVALRLRELGAHILFGPARSADESEAELVVYDPDGIRIHVVQRFAAVDR